MKKRKPANFDYDFTGLAVEVTGDDLYLINGGAEVENSRQGVANAQVGDTITRNNGQVVVLGEGDIKYAQDQLGGGGPTTDAASPTPTPNVTMGGATNSQTPGTATSNTYSNLLTENSFLTVTEINKILERNQGVYANREELLAEWELADKHSNDGTYDSGAYYQFKSIDSAVLYWAKTYADDSISYGEELGSSIFSCEKDGKTTYFYNIPYQGITKKENGKWSRTTDLNRKIDSKNEIDNARISIVTGIHSHGNSLPIFETETPSAKDMQGIENFAEDHPTYMDTEYLVTPGDFLFEFNANGITNTLKTNLVYDVLFLEESGIGGFTQLVGTHHPDSFISYGNW